MLFAGAQIARRDLQNAAGVDQEFHFDARQTRRTRRNFQLKSRQRPAILGQFALALQHVNIDSRLILDAGRKHFLRARGNRRISRNDFRHHAAHGLDAQRQRRDVEQQHVFHAAFENVGLHRRAQRHDFVGIEFRVRAAPEKFLDRCAHQRHARRAADQHNFFDFCGREFRVRQRLPHRSHRAIHDRANPAIEFRARDFAEILRVAPPAIGQREFHGRL